MHQSADGNEPLSIKQVEFNTISSSFGSLSEKVAGLHRSVPLPSRRVLRPTCPAEADPTTAQSFYGHRYLAQQTGYFGASPSLKPENLPANSPIKGLANGLAQGHKALGLAG